MRRRSRRDAFNPIVHACLAGPAQGALGSRMIPTIRSMIVATLLTVTVLVGGFGLFAAFRVNHEPLARLPVAATQFQLAAVDSAPRALSFAGDQPRLESNDALRAVATAVDHDAVQPEAVTPPAAAASETVASTAAATATAAADHAVSESATDTAAAEPPDHPAFSPAPVDAVAAATPVVAPSPEAAPQSEATAKEAAPQHEAALSPEATPAQGLKAAAAPAAETESAQQNEVDPSKAETAAAAAARPPEATQPGATVAATESITEMPPQEAPAPKVSTPAAPEIATRAPKPAQESARESANRKRLAAVRRIRKVRIAAHAQPANEFSGFGQANFPSDFGFQSAQSGTGGSFGKPARRQNARTQ